MSDTSIRISKEARDEAIRLSGDANSARVLVEDLIWKYKSGDLIVQPSVTEDTKPSPPDDPSLSKIKAEIGQLNMLVKIIGLGLFEEDEGIRNALNLISNDLGNCPSCNVKMTCPNCGCYVSDHLLPEGEDEG